MKTSKAIANIEKMLNITLNKTSGTIYKGSFTTVEGKKQDIEVHSSSSDENADLFMIVLNDMTIDTMLQKKGDHEYFRIFKDFKKNIERNFKL